MSAVIDSPGFRRWLRSPWAMFVVAVGLRLLVAYFLIPMRYTAENDHFSFGHEMGRVARSIALGEGFSSPLHEPTGPTAWVTPVWPYLLALVFRMFGVYSLTSLWCMVTLNAIFSALTCWPLIWMGRKYFGEAIGMAAGWSWVFFPYAIFVSANWIWDTTLTTLLLLYLLVLTLQLEEEPAPHRWYGYAALWGLAILTNPIVITVLPFWAAWLYLRLRHKPSWRLFPAASAAVLLLAILTPWFVRNAVVFHRWIPLRSNFWLEVRVRNSLLPGEAFQGQLHPSENPQEMARFARLGELAYMDDARSQMIAFAQTYPGTLVWLTFKRVVHAWTGIWDLSPDFLLGHIGEALNIPFTMVVSWWAFQGLRLAFRIKARCAWPLLLALFSFPLLYYLTETSLRYRHPLDPMLVLLAVAWLFRGKPAPQATQIA